MATRKVTGDQSEQIHPIPDMQSEENGMLATSNHSVPASAPGHPAQPTVKASTLAQGFTG